MIGEDEGASRAIATHRRRAGEVSVGSVSELCQIPHETPVKRCHLRGRSDTYRCGGKSLMKPALMPVGVHQHAPPESISKRAPSTTRTSLHAFRISHLAPFAKGTFANCDRNCDTPPSTCNHLRSHARRHQCRLSAQRGERPSIAGHADNPRPFGRFGDSGTSTDRIAAEVKRA